MKELLMTITPIFILSKMIIHYLVLIKTWKNQVILLLSLSAFLLRMPPPGRLPFFLKREFSDILADVKGLMPIIYRYVWSSLQMASSAALPRTPGIEIQGRLLMIS